MSVPPLDALIVAAYPWHEAILGPLREEICLAGLLSVETSTLEAFEPDDPTNAPLPRIYVVCDAGVAARIRAKCPDALIIHVGHGLISKNQPRLHYPEVDYVCVSSPTIAERYLSQGIRPREAYLTTGLIQTDPLFRASDAPRQPLPLDSHTAVVTYAPTWDPTLSSAELLGADPVTAIRGNRTDIAVIIKPHPHLAVIAPDLVRAWQALEQTHDNVIVESPEADLIPALLVADLLVTDASSAMIHFLALDRPLVLIDNPERHRDPSPFDANGIEWSWRDVGIRVDMREGLDAAVQQALADPGHKRGARLRRRREAFGDLTDGQSARRVANAITAIVDT